jgi:hypothetical protein
MAAKNFIQVNTGQRLGNQLRNTLDNLRASKDQLAKLKAIMDQQILDDPSLYSVLEQQFGLQTGDGQACYNLVAGVVADLAGANESSLLNRLG